MLLLLTQRIWYNRQQKILIFILSRIFQWEDKIISYFLVNFIMLKEKLISNLNKIVDIKKIFNIKFLKRINVKVKKL